MLDWWLAASFLLLFLTALSLIYQTFTRPEFYTNGLAFVLISGIFGFNLWRNKLLSPISQIKLPFLVLVLILILNTLNTFVFKFSIVPPILFLLGTWAVLGFYLEKSVWQRSFFVILIL